MALKIQALGFAASYEQLRGNIIVKEEEMQSESVS